MVPFFSYAEAAGRTMSASCAVSVRNKSCTTSKSSLPRRSRCGNAKRFYGIRADHVERVQLSLGCGGEHRARIHSRFFRQLCRPTAAPNFWRALCVRDRQVAGKHVGQLSHVRGAARIRVIAKRHVARLAGQGRAEFYEIANRRAGEFRAEHDDHVIFFFERSLERAEPFDGAGFELRFAAREPANGGRLRGPRALRQNPGPCAAA